MLLGNRI